MDNYGDAGVCWRLSRQLVREHGARVALVIDAPAVLSAIAPGAAPGTVFEGVAIERWPGEANGGFAPELGRAGRCPGRVVVSAFGCELPPEVRAGIAPASAPASATASATASAPASATASLPARPPPLWVNLEYLSAETWVEGCHGLSSRKPADGAVEHFFYPGFTGATGGLLRERDLLAERDAARRTSAGPANAGAQRQPAPGGEPGGDPDREPGGEARARRVSLFCYPHAPVRELLELIAAGSTPTTVLVPVGVAEADVTALAGALPPPGTAVQAGQLRLERFEWLRQRDYDRLLWSCDLNFVRGEDSWVRAIWAARPFVWQPYAQHDAAHLTKLDAFLARFDSLAGGGTGEAAAMMRAWSGAGRLANDWPAFAAALGRFAPACARVSDALAVGPDLASRLVEFCRIRL